jgi:hypothetical protein
MLYVPFSTASKQRGLDSVFYFDEFDNAGNVIETREHKGDFKDW